MLITYLPTKNCCFLIGLPKTCCFLIGPPKNMLFSNWPTINLLFSNWPTKKKCCFLIGLLKICCFLIGPQKNLLFSNRSTKPDVFYVAYHLRINTFIMFLWSGIKKGCLWVNNCEPKNWRRRTMSYDVAIPVLLSPLDYWRNSTPFFYVRPLYDEYRRF